MAKPGDPALSQSSSSQSTNLQLELPDESEATANSYDSSVSPGPQVDERSPDPRVYTSQWNRTWQNTELGKTPQRRKQLPVAAEPMRTLKIWTLLKDWVGKDINRLSVPVYINEPLCEMQRRAEGFHSSYLLDKAAEFPRHSRERLFYLTAFSVSIYSNVTRTTKPFKDLLNSTYELVYPEGGYRMMGEKVSHSPTTHVIMAEGKRWRFLGFDETHLEFSLQCYIRLKPVGIMAITFDDGDVYEWSQVPIYIQGLVMGSLKLEHKGQTQIICRGTGNRTRINVANQGTLSRLWKGSSAHAVSATLVENGTEVPGFEMSGRWDESFKLKRPNGAEEVLWKFKPSPCYEKRFNMSAHAMQLNELLPGMKEKLPPTDVRLRPDMRAFEEGYADKANVEKERLEMKQRLDRQAREAIGQPERSSRWFEMIPARSDEELPRWRYKGGYWETRETGLWTDIADIYGPGGEAKDSDGRRGSLRATEILV